MGTLKGRHLRSLPGLRGLPRREARLLSRAGQEIAHPAGSVVIKQGAGAAALHILLDGTVRVEIDGRLLRELGPGSIFGEIAFLDQAARTASVVAATPVRLHAVSAWGVKPLLDACPTFRGLLEEQAARRKAEVEQEG